MELSLNINYRRIVEDHCFLYTIEYHTINNVDIDIWGHYCNATSAP